MRTLAFVLGLSCLFGALILPGPARADPTDDELTPAERQIQLARADFAKGDYVRAIQASDSALRLDSGMKEAFKIKGLALEQLGEREDAEAMLKAYQTLNSGLPDDPEVLEALERLDRPVVHPVPVVLLGAGSAAAVLGFVMHGDAYDTGKVFVETPQPRSLLSEYEDLYQRNVAGLALGVAGSSLAGVGVGLLVVQLVDGPSAFAGLPYWSVGPGGATVGIAGRW